MTTDLESTGADSSLRRHSNAMTPMDDDRHDVMEKGSVLPIPVDALATASPVSPSTVDVVPPLSPHLTKDITLSDDKNTKQVSPASIFFLVVSIMMQLLACSFTSVGILGSLLC